MQVIVLAHAMQVYNLTEEKSRFYFNQSTLCWQLHCFVVFGFIKVLVNLFAFSMSCDCASRGIITSYSTHIYSFLSVFLLHLSLIFHYFLILSESASPAWFWFTHSCNHELSKQMLGSLLARLIKMLYNKLHRNHYLLDILVYFI